MDSSARVLSRAAGPLNAPLMFIGEAPGRLGADASGIPFHGDKAGHNFEELLTYSGIQRAEIFVTNAALCNPRDASGNNAPPSKAEVRNCSAFLAEQIDLLQPKVVVTLGSVALEALKNVANHSAVLHQDVRKALAWHGRLLIPLYHPGQRAMLHRSMANQRADYQFVAEQLRRLAQKRKAARGKAKTDVMAVATALLADIQRISYFGLHKLFFLLEYEATKRLGHTLTSAFFIRQKDGPYCTDLHLQKLRKGISELIIQDKSGKLILALPSQGLFGPQNQRTVLPRESVDLIHTVTARYGSLDDSELKTRVYLTTPMRQMLKREKAELVNLTNAPIDFDTTGSIREALSLERLR